MEEARYIIKGNLHLIKWKMKRGCLHMSSLNKNGQQWNTEHGQGIVHQWKQTDIIYNLSILIKNLDIRKFLQLLPHGWTLLMERNRVRIKV